MSTFTQVLEFYGIPARSGNVCCPIHGDQHPSMSIDVNKEVWKCHVCDKSGTARHLVAELENITAQQAEDWIVDRFGGPIPSRGNKTRPGRRRWLPPWRKR